eukprot:TRINITY_DN16266_c0_g1_i4.p1 TRINITY_DN16266_c0_g1~~TRINITY_DN16266_c0_g1_i4.p1  ORF type:complete len:136 (+),score=18.49 TRINITY_DN16266_c0_g1_i4:23-430(+)
MPVNKALIMAPVRCPAALIAALCLAVLVEAASAAADVVWVKGYGGASCSIVCAARGGCNEDAWPATEEEFKVVAESTGHDCLVIQGGGAKYDPSTDGRYCGWQGSDVEESDGTRCAASGDDLTYRFCPCSSDQEL